MSSAEYHPIPQAPVAPPPFSLTDEDGDFEDAALTDRERASYSTVRAIHFALGCAVLLPWNVLITATPYFLSRVVNSPFQSSFSSYMTCSFTAFNFCFLAHATVTSKQRNPARQIITTLILLSCLTFTLTISTYFHAPPGYFFAFVLINAIGQAGLGSYLQTSVVAIASLFGPEVVQTMVAGQAAVAVAVSSVQLTSAIASTWNESPEAISVMAESGKAEERSAFIFFGLSTLFLLVCVVMQKWMMTMPIYQEVLGRMSANKMSRESLAQDEHERTSLVSGEMDESDKLDLTQVIRVAKANWIYEVAVCSVFLITLSVFPAITATVQPTSSIHPLLFSSIHFLMFGVGDYIGRFICGFPRFVIWSANKLIMLSFLRALFIPLFLLCNVPVTASPIISSDFLFMLILTLFGVSNGYVFSLCMMAAPSLEHNPKLQGRRDDVDVAATVAGFSLVAGLAGGSVVSFAVRGLLCGCNPFVN